MSESLSAPGADIDTRPPDATADRIKVWDPLVRVFHWSLAAGFTTAFIVEDKLLEVHVWAGYLVLTLLAARVLWGLVGTRYARFADFVRSPAEVRAYLLDILRFRAARHIGHNPAGGAMILALLIAVSLTGLSGMALYGAQEFAGPLSALMRGVSGSTAHALEDVHEVLANLTLALVVLHIGGVLFSSLAHRENLVGAMITGYKRRHER
ncbi:cytochrome B [Thiorhodococcus mannitoliphagus]|uniref:Cytochrome B n=1 Tax=Thiorhodococcus mannitoliphagus TaxID=329406 RepID=A0A6P1DQI9_9GAMM|nr:cytochrome b/b6 domain-containing protein [Thiorhodococcus mannitoliphagus]NEX20169.1 cytochrome B [Thiorhodococcus mannitoliphagus]